jgi:hypothetical protein
MASSPMPHTGAGQALRQCPFPALRSLRVEEVDGEIVLSGSVPTYYLKQLAQETIMPTLGDRKLSNRVLVERS